MEKNKMNTENLNATFQNMSNLFGGFGDLDEFGGFGWCGSSLQTLILILLLANGCENSSYIWILIILLLANSDDNNNILWIIILLLFCNGDGFGGDTN